MASRKGPFLPDWIGDTPKGGASTPPGSPRGARFLPDWIPSGLAEDAAPPAGYPPPARGFSPDWARAPARGPLDDEPPGGRGRPLIVKGGHCVVPYAGIVTQDLLIEDGRIKAMGRDLDTADRDVIRAEGKYVLPGLVDPHVHLGIFAPLDQEMATETSSALVNGVTTVGLYLGGKGSYVPALESLIDLIQTKSRADAFVHLVLFDRDQLAEVPLYADRYGVRSFKVYMAGIPGLIPSADEGFLLDAMETVAALGEGAVLNIHAENSRVLEWADARARKEFPQGGLRAWEASHPAFAEREAVQRALLLAERSGARLYFVHVSAAETADLIRRAKAERPGRFYAETTSPYLSTDFDSPQGSLALMSPPIRSAGDREALWKALEDGTLDTIGTDHTPLTAEQKTGGRSFWETMPGYPAVGTHLPLLLDGARKHHMSVERLVEKVSANPARVFGVYPRKGTILAGSDADLVIVDMDRMKKISVEGARSRSDFALHQGELGIGWPVAVVKGGRVLFPEDPRLDPEKFSGAAYLPRRR